MRTVFAITSPDLVSRGPIWFRNSDARLLEDVYPSSPMPQSDQTNIVSTTNQQDALAHAQKTEISPQSHADQIAWIIAQIAKADYVPGPVGQAWAGQSAIVAAVVKQYKLPIDAATELVHVAHIEIRELSAQPGDKELYRRAAMERLNLYRKMVLKWLEEPSVETTYRFETVDQVDPVTKRKTGKLVSKKRVEKSKESPCDTKTGVGRLLEIERQRNALQGLVGEGAEQSTFTSAILEEMEEEAEGKTIRRKRSVVQRIRTGDPSTWSPEARAASQKVVDALEQSFAGGRSKAVTPIAEKSPAASKRSSRRRGSITRRKG